MHICHHLVQLGDPRNNNNLIIKVTKGIIRFVQVKHLLVEYKHEWFVLVWKRDPDPNDTFFFHKLIKITGWNLNEFDTASKENFLWVGSLSRVCVK